MNPDDRAKEAYEKVTIPAQLQKPEFRFCKVKKKQKRAIENRWQERGYKYEDIQLLNHIASGGNYGVITSHGNLAVLDIDDAQALKEIEPLLPPTFTVQTSKGKHFYYIIPDAKKIILETANTHIGELQAGRYFYVVGPNSTHETGTKYQATNEEPIAQITRAEIERLLAPYLPHKASEKLTIADIISLPSNPWQGPHPFHGSTGGKNFAVNGNDWFCFRHNTGGGPAQLKAIQEGKRSCEEIGKSPLSKEEWEALTKPTANKKRAETLIEKSWNLKDLAEKGIPETEWIINDILPRQGILIIGGSAGSFKTYLAQHIALCVGLGLPILQKIPVTPGKVLYLDHENNKARLLKRFDQLKAGHALPDFPKYIQLFNDTGIYLDKEEGGHTLSAILETLTPDLVIIDSLVRFMDGDEDKAKDVRKIFQNLKPLMEEHNVSFIAIHHTKKDTRGGHMDGLRGSGDLSASADCVLILEGKKGGATVTMAKNRHIDRYDFDSFRIKVTNPDPENKEDAIHMDFDGQAPRRITKQERAQNLILEWISKDGVEEFQRKDVLDKLKPRGLSVSTIEKTLKDMVDNDIIRKVGFTYFTDITNISDDKKSVKQEKKDFSVISNGNPSYVERSGGVSTPPELLRKDTLIVRTYGLTDFGIRDLKKYYELNPDRNISGEELLSAGFSSEVIENGLNMLKTSGDVIEVRPDTWRLLR